MASNVLDAAALTARLPKLLPESDKVLKSSQDGLAALIHTVLTTLDFQLVGLDDASPARPVSDNILPSGWNIHGPGSYTFRYKHDQSSLEFLFKVNKLGLRTLVNAITLESDQVASLDFGTNDFVSPSFFPHDCGKADSQPLVHGFIASNRIDDLVSRLKLQILQKLASGLRKDGYTEELAAESASSATRATAVPNPARPEVTQPPDAPFSGHYAPPPTFPHDNPLQIGRRDLDPIPMNPLSPAPLFAGPLSGDGMFVGPDHPIFAGRGQGGHGSFADRSGPWGGDGFLPPIGAPPGARFDPVGPGLGPFPPGGPGRGGFGRGPGGMGRGPHAGPDNDEFMPPGMGDMYM